MRRLPVSGLAVLLALSSPPAIAAQEPASSSEAETAREGSSASGPGLPPGESRATPPPDPPDPLRDQVVTRAGLQRMPFLITADEVEYEQARDLYTASGNVRIEQPGGGSLSADWVTFNGTTRVGVATGDVVIREGDDVIRADFATVDLGSLVAMATHAVVDTPDPGFQFEGERVRRTGVNTYRIEHGVFTTCRCDPGTGRRPWQVEAERADVRVGGYAVARNVSFRVLGVPLLYTPWAILPVKTERQSGVLVPDLAVSGRNGTELALPFFWAARPNLNVLLTPRLLSKRGVKGRTEVEYVFGETAFGSGGVAFLPNDDEVQGSDPDTPYSDNRWAFWLRHEQPLLPGLRIGADVTRQSDNKYVVDFEDLDGPLRSARFISSRAYASFARGGGYADVELALYDDTQSPNDLDRDDRFLQRLPDVRLSWLPRELIGPLGLGIDGRYTHFRHVDDDRRIRGIAPVGSQFFDTGPDGVFDPDETGLLADPHLDNAALGRRGEGDGIFQEGELLADQGHRFEIAPRLVVPARLGPLELLAEGALRETLWVADLLGSQTRTLLTGRVDARTRLQRSFRLGAAEVTHVAEPGIAFAVVAGQSQRRKPLFIPEPEVQGLRVQNADLRNLLRDPSDRVADSRLVQVALLNRLFTKTGALGTLPRLLAELRIGGGYDLEASRLANVFVDSELNLREDLSLTADLGYDPKNTRVSEARASFEWQSQADYRRSPGGQERRHRVGLQYRYLRDRPQVFENFQREDEVFEDFESGLERISQLNGRATWIATRRVDLFVNGYLSFDESSTSGGNLGFVFRSDCDCWRLTGQLERRLRPDDTRFTLEVQIAGFGL